MFKAFILVCSIFNSEACFVLEDELGPYKDKVACYQRTVEMSQLSIDNLKDVFPKNYACVKIGLSI